MVKLTKTEQEILQEIDKRGRTSIEHGFGFTRHSTYGRRRVNARNSLLKKGLITVIVHGVERDANNGRTSMHYWSVIGRKK